LAYNPPVDTAGPLTATIEGPLEVTETGVPQPVAVVLENKGGRAISGVVRLGLIDRWTAEPAAGLPFSVNAGGTTRCAFKVTAGEGTYSANYPIHAFVEFSEAGADGPKQRAHPILILETKLPAQPRVAPAIPWRPLAAPKNGELALWRVPAFRGVVAVFDKPPKTMPVGWQGSAEPNGGNLSIGSETLDGESRETIVIHPPWKDGLVGSMLVEFPLQLPEASPLVLRFANAVQLDGNSDGVTFRVRAVPLSAADGMLGEILFERHTDAHAWQDVEVDLGSLAGQAIRLQLESHPGPKNNTSWDRSYWAEPTLVSGNPPAAAPFPPQDDAGSRSLGTLKRDGQGYEVRIWPGQRGLLDTVVGFRQGGEELCFRGFEVRVLGGRIDDARSAVPLLDAQEEPLAGTSSGYQVRHKFQSYLGTFDLVGRLYLDGAALRAEFHLENAPQPRPWQAVYLEDVAAGPWSRAVGQVYAGPGNVIRRPQAFDLSFDGHRLSTSFVGMDFEGGPSLVQGVDVPPTAFRVRPDQEHCSLHAEHASTWAFIPAQDVWDAVKVWRDVNGLRAAGGVEKAAGRFVFDLWGGRYAESAEQLGRAFRYGLTDAMVVWHNWQRWGYDYRLPEIYPPNPQWGSPEELEGLIDACKRRGVPFALHDNYIDFYPDADGFSYERTIAFHQNGTPVKAWLNEGRGARSYRYRADQIEPFLQKNLRLIRDGLAPDAYFIDVWSSAPPYDYWTADGRFFDRLFTREVWREQFAWIRDFLGGGAPQISESGHDQLIGWLDGAQTNHLRVGNIQPGQRYTWSAWPIECQDAERTCWFDAAHHDRFVLHGAGYSVRYQAGLDARMHGVYSDDYLATEVLTGHPAMVPSPFGRDVVRKYWLTSDLMRALALRTIGGVEYVGGNLHRQHVRWSGGGEVWVNRGGNDWTPDNTGKTLPEFGFAARVPIDAGVVEASLERRGGLIVETARSPKSLYVNGRLVVDPRLPIELSVGNVKYLGDRRIQFELRWKSKVPLPPGYRPFLHFCDDLGEIIFQGNMNWKESDTRQAGVFEYAATAALPEGCAPGQDYRLLFGMYHPGGGARLRLVGPDVGDQRIRLGSIRLEGQGSDVSGVAWKPFEEEADPWLARQNADARPVEFGPVTTAGGCRLTVDGKALVVTPLPSEKSPEFTVAIRWTALPWSLPEPRSVNAVAEDGSLLGREPLRRDGESVLVDCQPGVFCYVIE
jgi:hypothetical protein